MYTNACHLKYSITLIERIVLSTNSDSCNCWFKNTILKLNCFRLKWWQMMKMKKNTPKYLNMKINHTFNQFRSEGTLKPIRVMSELILKSYWKFVEATWPQCNNVSAHPHTNTYGIGFRYNCVRVYMLNERIPMDLAHSKGT